MKNILFILLFFILLLFSGITITFANTDANLVKYKWNEVICDVLCLITYVVMAVTVLIIIIAGVKYITSEAPNEAKEAKKRIVYAVIGLMLVILAAPLVNYLISPFFPEPERFECWCTLGYNTGGGNTNNLTSNGGNAPNLPLNVKIVSPEKGKNYNEGEKIWVLGASLGGIGSPPFSFYWSSSPSGVSRTITKEDATDKFDVTLKKGTYLLTLSITDSAKNTGSDSVQVNVI